jgi:hypothetical protein
MPIGFPEALISPRVAEIYRGVLGLILALLIDHAVLVRYALDRVQGRPFVVDLAAQARDVATAALNVTVTRPHSSETPLIFPLAVMLFFLDRFTFLFGFKRLLQLKLI